MTSYVERAKKFIARIYPYLKDATCTEEVIDIVTYYNWHMKTHVECKWGATRIVLISNDYVIKFDRFDCNQSDREFGDCASEYEAYQFVKHAGYDYLFAPITEYYYKFGWIFYIMPHIYNVNATSGYAYTHVNKKEYYFLREHFNDLHEANYGWKDGHIVIIDYACWH